jgi:hypothetical protein
MTFLIMGGFHLNPQSVRKASYIPFAVEGKINKIYVLDPPSEELYWLQTVFFSVSSSFGVSRL